MNPLRVLKHTLFWPQDTNSKAWEDTGTASTFVCESSQATTAAAGVASGVEIDPGTSRKQDVKVLRAFENAGITKSLGTECQALAFGLLKSPLQAFGFSTGNKISVALEAPLDFLKTSHWRHGHCSS